MKKKKESRRNYLHKNRVTSNQMDSNMKEGKNSMNKNGIKICLIFPPTTGQEESVKKEVKEVLVSALQEQLRKNE